MMAVFERIEQLKRQYTDKYVVVDGTRPELSRFKDRTGVVKTVNMSGKALVEFDAHNDIGWYDIDPDYLTVVDKPLPKVETPKEKAAPAKGTTPPAAKTEKPTAQPNRRLRYRLRAESRPRPISWPPLARASRLRRAALA